MYFPPSPSFTPLRENSSPFPSAEGSRCPAAGEAEPAPSPRGSAQRGVWGEARGSGRERRGELALLGKSRTSPSLPGERCRPRRREARPGAHLRPGPGGAPGRVPSSPSPPRSFVAERPAPLPRPASLPLISCHGDFGAAAHLKRPLGGLRRPVRGGGSAGRGPVPGWVPPADRPRPSPPSPARCPR